MRLAHYGDVALGYLIAAVVVALVASAVGAALLYRRKQVWRTFAGSHGLRYSAHPTPHVTGAVDRREVNLGVKDRSSGSAELGVDPIRLSVRLTGGVPADLKILETGPAVRAVHRANDDSVISTGDELFDRRFTVRPNYSESAFEYLNDSRRTALLALADENDAGFVALRNGFLCIEGRMLVGNLTRVNNALERLLACARTLDDAAVRLKRRARAVGGRAH
jgi:hypothetical protein